MRDLLVGVDDQDHVGVAAEDGDDDVVHGDNESLSSGDSLEVKKTEGKQKSWPAAAAEIFFPKRRNER